MDPAHNTSSLFSGAGQAGNWLGQFFPYHDPHLEGIHAALGKMLEVYNTGVLVLAGLLTMWAIISFVIDSAHHGTIGGKRHSALYGPMRLVVALALLVPLGTGYNGAQIIAVKLASAGSGLANSIWKNFSPAATSFTFPQSTFASGTVDAFLQQALIDESCFAAIQLDKESPSGSIAIQALYPNPLHAGRNDEGAEIPLTADASKAEMDVMGAYGAITTESRMMGQTARSIRIHYNRVGNDDYCGSLDLPVPVVPQQSQLDVEDQTAYAAAYLVIRPELARYAQKLASAIDAAVKAHAAAEKAATTIVAVPPVASSSNSMAYISPEDLPGPQAGVTGPTGASGPIGAAMPPKPIPPIEVPQIDLPVAAWDGLIDQFNGQLLDATDRLQDRYIDTEIQQDYSQPSNQDWVWAGSLFFKLTKLSHDDLKLRNGVVFASLPNPEILPAEMRDDGVLAACPDLRSDVFLPEYHCRAEGKEATLVIKTAHDSLHTVESQRFGDALPSIDAGPGSSRKTDILSGNLIAAGRLDAVIAALAHSAQAGDATTNKSGAHFDSMFDAVNIGNALYSSSSSLFHASSVAGSNGVSSLVLSLFAIAILVPGFFLAIYLPLLPALRFFLGIAVWLITIFEALVALPLIALVQLRTEGEGILSHGRQGWFLLLQMLLRPSLMIVGLMAAIVIFDALYGFITWAIWSGLLHLTGDANQFGTGIEALLELLGYLMFWGLLVYFAANISFNAITAIPDRILVWIGAAEAGTAVQASGGAGASAQAVAVASGSPSPGLPGAPGAASMVTGATTSIQQITQAAQFGGPVGPQSSPVRGGANTEHFPTAPEVHIPEGQVVINAIVNGPGAPPSAPASGRPKPLPSRDDTDFTPPVRGGE